MPAHRASAYPRISPGPGPRQSPQERTHHRPDPTASSRRGRLPRGAVRSCRRARGGRARARRPSRGTSSWRSGRTPVTRQRIPESTDGRCVGWSAAGCKGGRALKAGCLLCGNRFLDRPRVKAPAPAQVLPSSPRRASRGRRSARARSRVRSTAPRGGPGSARASRGTRPESAWPSTSAGPGWPPTRSSRPAAGPARRWSCATPAQRAPAAAPSPPSMGRSGERACSLLERSSRRSESAPRPRARHRRARGCLGRRAPSWPGTPTTSASPQGSAPEEYPGGSPRSLLPPRRWRWRATVLPPHPRPRTSSSALPHPGSSPAGRRSSRRSCRGSRCGRPPGCWGSPASPSAATSTPTVYLDAETLLRHLPTAAPTLTEALLRCTDNIAARRQC